MSATVVGILARVDAHARARLRARLDALPGVETFEVGDAGKLGILLEADGAGDAHHRLRRDIERAEGVLATWPVYAHYGEEFTV